MRSLPSVGSGNAGCPFFFNAEFFVLMGLSLAPLAAPLARPGPIYEGLAMDLVVVPVEKSLTTPGVSTASAMAPDTGPVPLLKTYMRVETALGIARGASSRGLVPTALPPPASHDASLSRSSARAQHRKHRSNKGSAHTAAAGGYCEHKPTCTHSPEEHDSAVDAQKCGGEEGGVGGGELMVAGEDRSITTGGVT